MRKNRFYFPTAYAMGAHLQLDVDLTHQIRNVLRLQSNDCIELFNGRGQIASARIEYLDKKSTRVSVEEVQFKDYESPLSLHLGQGVGKGLKMEWVVQKATELGVQKITPLISEHSALRLNHTQAEQKRDHWQKVAIAACAQCGRNTLPEITEVLDFETWISNPPATCNLILHPEATERFQNLSNTSSVSITIGPEGGLSEKEIEKALQQNWSAVRLGPRILRTETAGIAAISILQSRLGDL